MECWVGLGVGCWGGGEVGVRGGDLVDSARAVREALVGRCSTTCRVH
jgi:hypothetical protein